MSRAIEEKGRSQRRACGKIGREPTMCRYAATRGAMQLSGRRVAREFDPIIEGRGKPLGIVFDKGTALTSRAILRWQEGRGVEWHSIGPGRLTPSNEGVIDRQADRKPACLHDLIVLAFEEAGTSVRLVWAKLGWVASKAPVGPCSLGGDRRRQSVRCGAGIHGTKYRFQSYWRDRNHRTIGIGRNAPTTPSIVRRNLARNASVRSALVNISTKIATLSSAALLGLGAFVGTPAPAQARGEGAIAAGVVGGIAAGALASQAYRHRGYGYRHGYGYGPRDGYRPSRYGYGRGYGYGRPYGYGY